jgi:hypothetical protein
MDGLFLPSIFTTIAQSINPYNPSGCGSFVFRHFRKNSSPTNICCSTLNERSSTQSENIFKFLLLVFQHTCSYSYVNGVRTAMHMSLRKWMINSCQERTFALCLAISGKVQVHQTLLRTVQCKFCARVF